MRWAFNLAPHVEANVVVVHAMGMLGRFEDRSDATKELEASVHELCDDCGIDPSRVRLHVARTATPARCCCAWPTIRSSADLLVVGSRGQGKHPGLLLGSTSLELAEHATVPLVIVPSL